MRQYKVNPSCPFCGEEHCYWRVTLSEEEQGALDAYYASRQRDVTPTSVSDMIDDIEARPLEITRQFTCGACHQEFEATVPVYREDEVGYRHPGRVLLGEVPL